MSVFGLVEGISCRLYLDENGIPVKRTPESNPYDYESFVLWGSKQKGASAVYTDRLFQWDHEKHDELCVKHFGNRGQYWSHREPEKIAAFLRDYFGEPGLELTMVMQGCNQSSGYPVWILFYRGGKEDG